MKLTNTVSTEILNDQEKPEIRRSTVTEVFNLTGKEAHDTALDLQFATDEATTNALSGYDPESGEPLA